MIFKAIGAVAVMISAGALGMAKAGEYKNRVEYLQSMEHCVVQLENEIRFTQTPIWAAFKNISSNAHETVKAIFLSAGKENAAGDTVGKIWRNSVARVSDKLFKEDKEIFLSFGDCIGNCDVEGQLKSIALFSARLAQTTEKAIEQCEKNRTLFKNLGLYTGILIAVLFL